MIDFNKASVQGFDQDPHGADGAGSDGGESVHEYYVNDNERDDLSDDVSLYDGLSEDGAYRRAEIEELVAYLVSSDGVETRGACVQRKGSSRKSADGKIKKRVIRYFKGERLADCFPNDVGHVPSADDPRLVGLGEALLDQNFAVEHRIVNSRERMMAPVEDGNGVFRPEGFYVWTSVAKKLNFTGDEKDFIQVVGGTLRRRRRRTTGGMGGAAAGGGADDAHGQGGHHGDHHGDHHGHSHGGESSYVRVGKVGGGSGGGINWLHIGLLLLLFGPPIMMGVMWAHEFVTTSAIGVSLGLSMTHRERLMAFYGTHNPAKATDKHVDKLLKKYEGKEKALLERLERKYERIERAQEEDRKYAERGHGE